MPLSVLLRPVSVFWYITGTTIKNAMNTDRFFAVNHIRHITTKDATGVKAMRQASKNIMYTVVNSRAYDPENLKTGLMNWQIIAIVIDIILGVLVIFLEVLTIKKYKKDAAEEPVQTVTETSAE